MCCFCCQCSRRQNLPVNFRRQELDFFTDLRSLIDNRRCCGLNNSETQRLLIIIKKKITFFKVNIDFNILLSHLILITGLRFCSIRALLYSSLVVTQYCIWPFLVWLSKCSSNIHMCLLYVTMIDCLTARMNSVNRLKTHTSEKKDEVNIQSILNAVESIFETLRKYNLTLTVLLSETAYFFRTGPCSLFVVVSLDIDVYLRTIVKVPITLLSSSFSQYYTFRKRRQHSIRCTSLSTLVTPDPFNDQSCPWSYNSKL